MSAQQSLTFLFDAIALSFLTIATIDLSQEIIKLYTQVFVASQQPPSTNSQPQALPKLLDPWLLPVEDTATPSDRNIQQQPKPILLLAQAKAMGEVRLSSSTIAEQSGDRYISTLEGLLPAVNAVNAVNLDTIKLRQARKIAKMLEIAQKVNGKDKKLDWLKAQIKAKLQQERSPQPEVIAVVRELIAC